MLAVTTPSFSIVLNGALEDYFQRKRGLRQGDPLSPFLFVLAMEYLNRLFTLLKKDAAFSFHPKCSRIGLTHLCFADDLMVFCRGDVPAVKSVVKVLKRFGDTSGLVMNPTKSKLYKGGVRDSVRAEILGITGMVEGKLPMTYLGIPLHQRTLQIVEYRPLLHSIQRRIDNWATRQLTYEGRRQLIVSVLSSVVHFWASIFALSVGLISEIERICRNFLWTGGYMSRGRARVAWANICFPKDQGGLKIQEVLTWNKTLLFQRLYDAAREGTVWNDWLRSYKLRGRSIWCVQDGASDSSLWRRMLLIRDEVKMKLGMVICTSLAAMPRKVRL